jgi:hypothetical protein
MEYSFKIALATSTGIFIGALGITTCFLTYEGVHSARANSINNKKYTQIRSIFNENICAALSASELERLDSARKEGPNADRYTLGMIHFERYCVWQENVRKAKRLVDGAPDFMKDEEMKELKEAESTSQNFRNAYRSILNFEK